MTPSIKLDARKTTLRSMRSNHGTHLFLDGGNRTWSENYVAGSGLLKEPRKARYRWGRSCLYSWTARGKAALYSHWLYHSRSRKKVRNPLSTRTFRMFSMFVKSDYRSYTQKERTTHVNEIWRVQWFIPLLVTPKELLKFIKPLQW